MVPVLSILSALAAVCLATARAVANDTANPVPVSWIGLVKDSMLLVAAIVLAILFVYVWKHVGSHLLDGILTINKAQQESAKSYLAVTEGTERIAQAQERMTERQVELASKMLEISTANAEGQRSFHESVEGLREVVTELRQVAREMREAREGGR